LKKLTSLNHDNLKKYCINHECFLKYENFYDLDCINLFLELKVLQEILPKEKKRTIDILNFPNVSIAYRILLTIPITVVAKRSFLELKLLKSYQLCHKKN
jgi:hypothetical protein